MCPVIVSGIVSEDAQISYWPLFSLSLITVPEIFAKFNLYPSRILTGNNKKLVCLQ